MSHRGTFLVLVIASLLVLTALLPARAASAVEPLQVSITNFPGLQLVEGKVAVEGVVHNASFTSVLRIEVPPVRRDEVGRLIPAGLIDTEGFGAAVLSLAGQTKGVILRPGQVGALLVPDEEEIVRAFEEQGVIQFPLEVSAGVGKSMVNFASQQPRFIVGFPHYRVLLYNETDKSVVVDLYVYRTNA